MASSQDQQQQNQGQQKTGGNIKAHRGMLITCDGALKQFLLDLNSKSPHKFVMRDLDEKHLFINTARFDPSYSNIQEWLHDEVDKWNKQYTYIEETERVDD